jgi:hypothetical protein
MLSCFFPAEWLSLTSMRDAFVARQMPWVCFRVMILPRAVACGPCFILGCGLVCRLLLRRESLLGHSLRD